MASFSSRTSQHVVGIATSATKIVATAAVLAIRKHKSRSKHLPFDDNDSVTSLVAIDENEALSFDVDPKARSRTVFVRSRSPSPTRELLISNGSPLNANHNTSPASTRSTISIDPSLASDEQDPQFFISNLHDVSPQKHQPPSSENSMVPGSPEFVDFHLPQLGTDGGKVLLDPCLGDPTSLCNILRPWQCDFLESLGITTATEFLRAKKRRNLAKAMKRWRKHNHLRHVKKETRKVALHIWGHICEAVIESVEKQQAEGKSQLEKPQILTKPISSDSSLVTAATLSMTSSVTTGNQTHHDFHEHVCFEVPQSFER